MTDSVQAPVIGLFPLSYVIGTDAPGAQRLVLDLLVHPADRTLRGTAQITQSSNPPLDLHLEVWGTYSYQLFLPPSPSSILITLQGNHGGPTANSPIIFSLHLAVGTDWQKGQAGYRYLNSQGQWIVVEAPAHREDTRIKAFGDLDIPALLHAATLEAAIATGDLAHLKALAAGDAGTALTTAIESTKSASGKAGKSSRA